MQQSRLCRQLRIGHTVVELSLSIMIVGILFSGGYRVLSLYHYGLAKAKQTNIALYAMESAKNMVLQQWDVLGRQPEVKDLQNILQRHFPRLHFEISDLSIANGKSGLRLELVFHHKTAGRQAKFVREVSGP